jgi:hypothetical protein
MPRRLLAVLLVAAVALAACGSEEEHADDEPDAEADAGTSLVTDETSSTTAPGTEDEALPQACELVPRDAVNGATGLTLGEGAEIGDERRAVCAFSAPESGGVGVTVGIEAGGRFDEKAQASRDALGDEGEDVGDLGDDALFFFDGEDTPEGLGGVLVAVGDLSIDVTVQGAGDEDATRDASLAIAQVALDNL